MVMQRLICQINKKGEREESRQTGKREREGSETSKWRVRVIE